MIFVFLYIQVIVQVPVLSEWLLAPPQNILVEKGLLTWTNATQEGGVTYSVQYRSLDTKVWKNVAACVQTSFKFCNITYIKAENENGCVTLRVRAERRGLTSKPVEACSQHGDSCSPEVSLTPWPGSLTVHLSRNHSMALEHGGHVKHRVYYGKEGESLLNHIDGASSVSIHGLEEGQRYCIKVQYINYNIPVGAESCTQCEVIPESRNNQKQTQLTVAVVVPIFLLILILVIAYVLIYQSGRIKHCLRPPYEISDILLQPFPEHHILSSTSTPSESYDVISSITPEEFKGE